MSLENPDTLDLIFTSRDDGEVVLVIYDGGEIPEDGEREVALQDKLSSYAEFIESGKLVERYPKYRNKQVSVWVVCAIPPTERMKSVFEVRSDEKPEVHIPVKVMTHEQFAETMKGQGGMERG